MYMYIGMLNIQPPLGILKNCSCTLEREWLVKPYPRCAQLVGFVSAFPR